METGARPYKARTSDGAVLLRIALIPRRPRNGEEKLAPLSGFIPHGNFEGAILFGNPVQALPCQLPLHGELFRAKNDLERVRVDLSEDTAGTGGKLLQFTNVHGRSLRLHLTRCGPVNDRRLTDVAIVGHRCLGFGGLDNKLRALTHAWILGASGVEFDVTAPFRVRQDNHMRVPLIDQNDLRVMHPVRVCANIGGSRLRHKRIDDVDTCLGEVRPIPCDHRQAVNESRGRDQTVLDGHARALLA